MAKTIKRAERERIEAMLVRVATEAGAVVTVTPQSEYRNQSVRAVFPLASVMVDIGGILQPGLMAHWHDAKRNFIRAPFDSINEYHYGKATQYRADPELFEVAFRRACEAVADGSAFAPG